MQQGMLFHSLFAPDSGVYIEQFSCTLQGSLKIAAFEQAWRHMLERHTILRTAFVGQGLKEPVQVVYQQVPLTLRQEDWRALDNAQRQEKLQAFMVDDRQLGFDLAEPPLMRLALLRVAENAYEFVWTYHHMLLDGWSMPLVLSEFLACYEAFSRAKDWRDSPVPLAPARPYRDYIVWLRRQDLAKAEAFWRRTLQGLTAATPLVIDRQQTASHPPEEAEDEDHGAPYGAKEVRLPPEVTASLQTLARRNQLTLNTVVQAAWALLLSRYSGEQDVVFGATVSGRPVDLPGAETMIGLFINTLPIRVRIDEEQPLLAWLQEFQAQQAELQQYQYSPLVQIQGWSDVPRGQPLFETLMVFENYPVNTDALERTPVDHGSRTLGGRRAPGGERGDGLARHGESLEIRNIRSVEQTNYPITFVVGVDSEMSLRIIYDNRRLSDAAIVRMLGHLRTLLEGMAADESRAVKDLPLLTPSEQRYLLVDLNNTARPDPPYLCAHHWFEAQAKETPESVALSFAGHLLTCAELNERANLLAHFLRQRGVGPEVLVGLCMERSVELIVAIMAVLKAGGAYVPLDPAYPPERLAFMIRDFSHYGLAHQDSVVPIVITQSELAPLLRESESGAACPPRLEIISLDVDWEAIARQGSTDNPDSGVMPDNLAYVIYTSGSTGVPKGTLLQHRGLCNVTRVFIETWGSSPGHRLLQFFSPSFDGSLSEIFPALLSGSTLCLADRETLSSPQDLWRMLRDERIDTACIAPAMWGALPADPLPDLRTLSSGGEALLPEVVKRWLIPGRCFVNFYGPTEATVAVTSYPMDQLPQGASSIPIGRPMANTSLYILDSRLRPVPMGVPGELCIGGVQLARGYLNRPEQTAAKFVPHPFSDAMEGMAEPGARIYRTGDLVRYLPDGNVEFLGRIDDQVKIRGFRIELGEIETVLSQYPGVQQVAVTAREDIPGNKRLVAYVCAPALSATTPDQGLATRDVSAVAGELRSFLQGKLPVYMVPGAFVFLDALPLTPNGKVDRKALPAPEQGMAERGVPYVAPRTPVEELLTELWAQVLGVERVGVHDSFFDLGGHSLLATQLISRVRQAFQIDMPLRDLFDTPILADLAERVDVMLRQSHGLVVTPIEPAPREEGRGLPLSFAQQRLWFLDQLEPDSPLYNVPMVMRIQGAMNVTVLEQSLNEIVRRHEALRTTFTAADGVALQHILPEMVIPLSVVDLATLPDGEREQEAMRLATAEAQRPFSLAVGPLLRAQLLRMGDEDHIVLLTMHHIVSDGWSMTILLRELLTIYEAFSKGQPSPLPDLGIQYADFAHWQRNWLQGEALETQLAYWRRQLHNAPPLLELPTDRPRPALQTYRGASRSFDLPAELYRQIKALSRKEGATVYMTLLAAFQALLCRYTGQTDISVGTPIANRNRTEIEELIGFFVNTLVLRTDLTDEPTFRKLLVRVRETTLAAYAHQDLPFEMLVDELKLTRDMSYSPLFQVMFVLQDAVTRKPWLNAGGLSGLTLSSLDLDSGVAKFDLVLEMVEQDDSLSGTFEYSTDLFDESTIDRMIGHLRTLLQSIAANPDQSVASLPMLTEDDTHLLDQWNETAHSSPQACIHQLFEDQVSKTPESIAVTFQGHHLTYAALNERANRLAHYLRAKGVGPEVMVGLCMERSWEALVGLLGIMKAGGVYVPMDPEYPTDRLAFMLQDLAAATPDRDVPLLLTQKRLVEQLPQSSMAQVIHLDADWESIEREGSADNPVSGVELQNLAYVIYTSGSTGTPKGALLAHRGLTNLIHYLSSLLEVTAESSVLQFASLSFDASLPELFMALTTGARLVMASQETLGSVPDLLALLRSERITTVSLPPTLLRILPSDGLPDLHAVISAGEACPPEVATRWSPGRLFVNGYGPTETTVGAACYRVQYLPEGTTNVPIGRPMDNVRLYVVDRHLQRVPVGVPGELCIGGIGVARGYLNRPELTADKFVADPFHGDDSARMYRSGDLVRYRADGNLEFMGRIDQQVKIHGFRIELGEVEAVLAQHPGVRQAVAMAREDAPGVRRLVAYIVPEQDAAPSVTEMRGFAERILPVYMVPAAFVVLDQLPLMLNGKVDRRALPAPEGTRPDLQSTYVAPRNEQEEALARIWAEALGLDRVGIQDNFFELGGDSILSIQVIAHAGHAGIRLTPKQFFVHPTIAGMIESLASEAVYAEQGIVSGAIPLTPVQSWFFANHPAAPHHFNTSMLLDFEQKLDPESLRKTVELLMVHHDALRLRFSRSAGGWEQFAPAAVDRVPFEHVDLAALGGAKQQAAVEARTAELQRSFDLGEGPLFRVAYLDLGPRRSARLFLLFHHLVMDGVSWRILLSDLQHIYKQVSRGESAQMPEKTTSFRYWAQRLVQHAQTETVSQEAAYWLMNRPEDVPDLKPDYPDGAATYALMEHITLSLNEKETYGLLHEVPEAYGTQINDVLLTALVRAISHRTGRRKLWLELEGHGREDIFPEVDLSRTVGWFTTMFPVMLDLGRVSDLREELRAVSNQLRQIPNHGLGYGLLRYLGGNSGVQEQLASFPAPQVNFNYLGQFDQVDTKEWIPFRMAKESVGPEQNAVDVPRALLHLVATVSGAELGVRWLYSREKFRAATVKKMAEDMMKELRIIISEAHHRE